VYADSEVRARLVSTDACKGKPSRMPPILRAQGGFMKIRLALAGVAMGALMMGAHVASDAQVALSIGGPPVCPYGYYDFAPYNCAPYGYYGPEWFNGGVFIGAGPWFHGPHGFYGHVNNHFDPHHGYHGGYPHPMGHFDNFHGNEMRDGMGHVGGGFHGGGHH
jgi:hypothetical protein